MPTVANTGQRKLSALPSARARAVAFVAIMVAGIAGALIGSSFVKLQCAGTCGGPASAGGLFGALLAAGGVAVVAVLALRAMGEWRGIAEDRDRDLGSGPDPG
jgi:hypothetical protein